VSVCSEGSSSEHARFLVEVTSVFQLLDVKAHWHHWGSRGVLDDGFVLAHMVAEIVHFLVFKLFKESHFSITMLTCVVWQADVEEARIFQSGELVHVVQAWSDQKQVILVEYFLLRFLGPDIKFHAKDLVILIIRKLVILELVICLVIGCISQFSKHELEVHTHIWMIMDGHDSSLLDEKNYKSVVLITLDGHLVQITLEVVGVCRGVSARDSTTL